MKANLFLSFSLAAVMLAGCSTAPSTDVKVADARVAEGRAAVCQRETPTGTHLSTTRCRSAEEVERDQQSVDAMRHHLGSSTQQGTVLPGQSGK